MTILRGEVDKIVLTAPYFGKSPRSTREFILPGVVNDARYAATLVKIYEALHKRYLLNEGTGWNKIPNDFNRLLNLTGYPMNPLGTPFPFDRSANPPSDQFKKALPVVCDLMTREPKDGLSLQISRLSHSGLPFMTKDMEFKTSCFLNWRANHEWIKKNLRDENFKELANGGSNRVPIWFASSIGRRAQPDSCETEFEGERLVKSVSKPRRVHDYLGREVIADKSLPFTKLVHAMRERTVWGISGTCNYMFQAIAQKARASYFERYAASFHHVDVPKSFSQLTKGSVNRSSDVSTFDQTMSNFMIRTYHKFLIQNQGLDPIIEKAMNLVITPPFVKTSDVIGVKHSSWEGNPFDPAQGASLRDCGLPSGIFSVSDVGKAVMTSYFLGVAFAAGLINGLDYETVDSFLAKGGNDRILRYMNMGDDSFFSFKDESTAKAFEEAMHADKTFSVKWDPTPSFLSYELIDRDSTFDGMPGLTNGVVNPLVPEVGISNPKRSKTWAFGLMDRLNHYEKNPQFRVVYDEALSILGKEYGCDFAAIIAKSAVEQQIEIEKVHSLSNVYDQMVLANPDYLHYRIRPEDVSYDVLESLFINIPPEEVEATLDLYK